MTIDDDLTTRDDLDGLYDDQTIVEDPEIRRAKTVLVALTILCGAVFTITIAVFFRPEGQEVLERWPNGYRKTQTNYISAPNKAGRLAHGPHRAWHANGAIAEQGRFERGIRIGDWKYWDKHGRSLAAPVEEQSPPAHR